MSFTRVQVKQDFQDLGSSVSGELHGSMTVVAGEIVIFRMLWLHPSANNITITSFTLQDNGSVNLIGSPQRGTYSSQEVAMQLGYVQVTNGGTKNVDLVMSSTNTLLGGKLVAIRYSASGGAVAYDNSQSGTGSNTQPSIALTTGVANAMIFAAVAVSGNQGDPSPGAGLSYVDVPITDIHGYEDAEECLDAGGAGGKAVDFVTSGTGIWLMQAISLKDTGGGGGGPTIKEQVLKLVDENGNPLANLAGLTVLGWDTNVPLSLATQLPVDHTAVGTTDASGFLHFTRTNTTLAVGNTTFMLVSQSDGSTGQSPAPRAFFGPVQITAAS